MRAMKAGKVPSQTALTAIGQALQIAKNDRLAGKQIQSLFAHAGDGDSLSELNRVGETEITAYELGREYELAALDWAYKDAVTRAPIDPQTAPQSGKARTSADGSTDGKPGERNADEAGGTAREQRLHPSTFSGCLPPGITDHTSGSGHQQATQIRIALLGDPTKSFLATCRM